MPLKLYCPNPSCSEPILYDLTKPIFCPFCSTNLNAGVSFANKKPIQAEKQIIRQQEIDEELETDRLENFEEVEESTLQKHKLHGLTSNKNKRSRREIEEDNIDVDDLNISALQLDVPISTKKEKGLKFEDVAFQQKTGFSRTKPKKVNKKKEFEQFQLEAGAGGRKDISIEAPEDKE